MASVYLPTGRTTYRIEFKDQHGKIRTVSSGHKVQRNAESLATKLEEDADRLRAGKEPKHPDLTGAFLGLAQPDRRRSWDEVVGAYLNELTRHGSGAESDHYRDSRVLLARIQRECGWKVLGDVRADQFTEFLGRLADQGRAPRTQNRYHDTLRAACNFWERQGWLAPNPMDRLKAVKVGEKGRRYLRRPYTADELERLCAAVNTRAHAVTYRVAAYSGLRYGELKRLTREDCTPVGDRPRWHVPAGKTKNGRAVRLPMAPECAAALAEQWSKLSPGAPLLKVPMKRTFKAHRAAAGIPAQDERGRWADFHSLRYTFCVLLSRLYPIEVVAKFMRHGTLNLTHAVYLDLGLDREGDGEWVLPPLLSGKSRGEAAPGPARPEGQSHKAAQEGDEAA